MFWQAKNLVRGVDIVNARVPDYTGLCGAYWARKFEKPMFVNLIADWHTYKTRQTRLKGILKLGLQVHLMIYCWLERWMCSNQLLFAQGEHIRKIYDEDNEVHLSISSSHYKSDIVGSGKNQPHRRLIRLLAVGRLVYVKGHRDLICAIAALKVVDPMRRYELTILGEGPDAKAYFNLAQMLGVDSQIKILGQIDRGTIFTYYDQADVFCLSSYSEGTPKVVLEAMARGTPVVATDVGGVSTVVEHGISGTLVMSGKPKKMAAAIKELLDDSELYERYSRNGLTVADAHTVEAEWGGMINTIRARFTELWQENA
jgi:glycosyltransferase involved in cell wall biosynthesis